MYYTTERGLVNKYSERLKQFGFHVEYPYDNRMAYYLDGKCIRLKPEEQLRGGTNVAADIFLEMALFSTLSNKVYCKGSVEFNREISALKNEGVLNRLGTFSAEGFGGDSNCWNYFIYDKTLQSTCIHIPIGGTLIDWRDMIQMLKNGNMSSSGLRLSLINPIKILLWNTIP